MQSSEASSPTTRASKKQQSLIDGDETLNARTIRITPEEVVFAQAVPGVTQVESLTLTNTLGVPIDILLKCSNPDRLEVTPGKMRLEKAQTHKIEVKLHQQKPFHSKSTKLKDFLFIKGDYFDQKIPILTYPGSKPTTLSCGSSLQRDSNSVGGGGGNTINERQSLTLMVGDSFGRQVSQQTKHDSTNDAEFLREKVTFLTTENQNLRDQLDRSLSEVDLLKSQSVNHTSQLDNIRQLLSARDPNLQKLLDEALKHERMKNERKEQKVLEILQYKDQQISTLEKKLAEMESALVGLKDAKVQFEALELTLNDKLNQHKNLIRQLELQLAEKNDLLQDFSQTDLQSQKTQIQELQAQVAQLSKQQTGGATSSSKWKQEAKAMEAQLDKIREESDSQQQENARLTDELRLAKRQVEQLFVAKTQLQTLQRQVDQASRTLSQVTGPAKHVSIDECADEIVTVVQRVQSEYSQLEAELHAHILAQQKAAADNSATREQSSLLLHQTSDAQLSSTGKYESLLREHESLKVQLAEQAAELVQLRRQQNNKSTLGGGLSSDSGQQPRNIFVQDTLQVNSSSTQQQQHKLSHRMKQMRVREDQLLDQVSHMKHEIFYQTSQSDENAATDNDESQAASMPAEFWGVRVAELEHLIYKQREQCVALEEALIESRRRLTERDTELQNRVQLLELKNRNLQQMYKPQNNFSGAADMFSSSVLTKSPPTNSETYRQLNDVQSFELKQKCNELEAQRDQLLSSKKLLTAQCDDLQKQLALVKSDLQLKEVGLNAGQESQLTLLIDDQKQKILQLEQNMKTGVQQQPVDMTLASIRDDYITRVEQLTTQIDSERQAVTQQLIQATQKCENYRAQLSHMEKRELKQNAEIDQMKELLQTKQAAMQQRQVEVDSLIEAKNQLIESFERDCSAKDRQLQERQEQLSVLLAAMDNGNTASSPSDLKQKLACMAADKCNLLADKSSLEQRLAFEKQNARQSNSKSQKLSAEVDQLTEEVAKLKSKSKIFQTQYENAERKLHEVDAKLLDQQNRLSDDQFNHQRAQFALKQKSELISTLQTQLRQQETSFRDQLCSLKQSVIQQASQHSSIKQRDNSLRVAIQKLHLQLLETDELSSSQVVSEMETTLSIAAQTVERLQNDIKLKCRENMLLKQEWDAFASNVVLTQRYELQLVRHNRYRQLMQQWEVDQATFAKSTIDQHLRSIVTDLETRLDHSQKQCQQLQDEVSTLSTAKSQLKAENAQLKASVAQFDVDQRNHEESVRLRAEIDVDKRFRSKEEALKSYVEAQLKGNELSKEVAALKLTQINMHHQTQAEISQRDSLQHALKTAKSNLQDCQAQITTQDQKCNQVKAAHRLQIQSLQQECDRLRRNNFGLDKDIIRLSEQLHAKVNEVTMLRIKVEAEENGQTDRHEPVQSTELARRVQELQEELIELRQNRMLEIDELRLQYELEVAEAKRGLQQSLKQSVGQEPAELQQINSKLAQVVDTEMQLREEVSYFKRQSQHLERENEELKADLADMKKAFQDVESFQSSEVVDSKRSLKKSKPIESTQQFDFVVQPPTLVKSLVQAKLAENNARSKLRRQLQIEVSLRQQLSHKIQQSADNQLLISDLIDQNDAILQILNDQAQPVIEDALVTDNSGKQDDYHCLVQAVVALATELAKHQASAEGHTSSLHEVIPPSKVMQAQRAVIRSLQRKSQSQKIRYVPERETDRQIWLLELLEGQIIDAETFIQRLQDFIKRLQVGVSGSLQSAAEVRATSMDLCQNTKEASEELKCLRHVAALIKHDVQSQSQQLIQQQSVANPFSESIGHQQQTSHRSMEKVITERDTAQNQLSLTSKIKQSLEQELVNSKLSHATELQSHIQALKALQLQNQQLCKRIDDLQSENACTCQQLAEERARTSELHQKLEDLAHQYEKVLKRADAGKGSQTSLRKLQTDMQEWRRMSDHNLRQKQEALDEATRDLAKCRQELGRIKSENLMLRRVQQDHRSGEETNQLLREIQTLKDQLEQAEARTQEVQREAESEKQQIAEKLESIENIRSERDTRQNDETSKLVKKLNVCQHELKSKLSEITSLKDTLAQQNISLLQANQDLKDHSTNLSLAQQKCDTLQAKLASQQLAQNEWHTERQQLLALQEGSQQQVASEMIELRQTFFKLKEERDSLKRELAESANHFNDQYQQMAHRVKELEHLKRQHPIAIDSSEVIVLQERNSALVNDLKYFRAQCDTLQAKHSSLLDKQAQHEAVVLALRQELLAVQDQLKGVNTQLRDARKECQDKEHENRQLGLDLAEREAQHLSQVRELQTLNAKMRHGYEVAQSCVLSQMQSGESGRGNRPVKEVDQALQLVQAQTVLKSVRKDLAVEKGRVTKLKAQKAELLQSLQDSSQQRTRGKAAQATPPLPKWKEELCEIISDSSQLKKVLKQLRDSQAEQALIIDLQHKSSEAETQLFQAKATIEELQSRVDSLQEAISNQKSSAKDGKQVLKEQYSAQLAQHKETIKQLQAALAKVKSEFVSKDETQPLQEHIAQLQVQLKSCQQEIQRKNKLIQTLRQNKDSLNQEVDLVMQDMKGLKDDNSRLQKALKEGQSKSSELKEMRETYEWLQKTEKQMKDELASMYEKNKGLRSELQRKESQLSQYRSEFERRTRDQEESKELQTVVAKLKEEKKRIKLELEIAQNQIRTLRQQERPQQPSVDTTEVQKYKGRAKRAEQSLKKSVGLLQRLGNEIVKRAPGSSSTSQGGKVAEYQSEHLREAQDILGISLNELEDFVACSTPGKQSHASGASAEIRIAKKLARLKDMPDTLDCDIDEIGEYCCKLLEEIQQ